MEFEIQYYTTNSGRKPVEEFILELKRSNSPLSEQIVKGLEKLKNRAYHKFPLSKYLEPGLWELRVISKNDIARIIYTFSKGKISILLHAFIKKQQKTPVGQLEIAKKRLTEMKELEVN